MRTIAGIYRFTFEAFTGADCALPAFSVDPTKALGAFQYLPALIDFSAYTPQQLVAGSAAMAALSTLLSILKAVFCVLNVAFTGQGLVVADNVALSKIFFGLVL